MGYPTVKLGYPGIEAPLLGVLVLALGKLRPRVGAAQWGGGGPGGQLRVVPASPAKVQTQEGGGPVPAAGSRLF